MWSGRSRGPPSPWWARTLSTSRLRSERVGGGHARGHGGGLLPCPLLLQDGHRHALGRRPGPRPGLRALGRQPGRGSQCWDQSQTGQEVMEAPVAQGSRGQKVPQTLPCSDPAPAVRQAAADNGRAGCGQHPWEACLSRSNTGPVCLARPAWHRFLDTPTPWEAASPPTPFQGLGAPPQTQAQPSHMRCPQGQD